VFTKAGFPSNAMNATDGTDATADEASDGPFHTLSFINQIKCGFLERIYNVSNALE